MANSLDKSVVEIDFRLKLATLKRFCKILRMIFQLIFDSLIMYSWQTRMRGNHYKPLQAHSTHFVQYFKCSDCI